MVILVYYIRHVDRAVVVIHWPTGASYTSMRAQAVEGYIDGCECSHCTIWYGLIIGALRYTTIATAILLL